MRTRKNLEKNLEKNRASPLPLLWMRGVEHCVPRMFRWPPVSNVGESTDMCFELKSCVKTRQTLPYNSCISTGHGKLVKGCEYTFTGRTGERLSYVDASDKTAKYQSKDAMRIISSVEKGALSAFFVR